MEALGSLYQLYAPGLLALVCRLTQSVPDAEDIVQDLFVGLPEALRSYQEAGRFEAWLRRIAVRLTLMRLRGSRRKREVSLEAATALPDGSDRSGHDLHLTRALERLDPEARALILLRTVEGYSHTEIAALLGIRPGTAQVRYHRALRQLRSHLDSP